MLLRNEENYKYREENGRLLMPVSVRMISYYLTKNEFKALMKVLGEMLVGSSGICFDYPTDIGGKPVI